MLSILAILMSAFALSFCVVNTLAADRAVLGDASQIPLTARTDPNTIKTLTLLRKQTEAKGTAQIIVGVRVAFAPEGTLDAASVAQQRDETARMQSAVLEKVPSLKQRAGNIKRFKYIPFMAMDVNAAELEALAGLVEVISIEENGLVAPTF